MCRLRQVLLLTALDGVEEKVRGLADGAADYLTKPFALAELVARLEALSRAPSGAVALPRTNRRAAEFGI